MNLVPGICTKGCQVNLILVQISPT